MTPPRANMIQKVEARVTKAVDRVEKGNGDATVGDRLMNFLSECWRMFWPMVVIFLILRYYEGIRLAYFKAQALEPSWVGILKKVQAGMLGLLLAHITRSGAFPYVKLRRLYNESPELFSRVFQAVMVYYGVWIVGMLLAVG